jgi:hypothetical protein
VEEARQILYVPERQAGVSEEEVIGVLGAHALDWEGSASLRSGCWALEEAKFHSAGAQRRERFPEAVAD